MRYYLIIPIMISALSVTYTSCGKNESEFLPEMEQPRPPDDNNASVDSTDHNTPDNGGQNPVNNKLTIRVGENVFAVTLGDNAAAKAFKAVLPLTVNMSEMNGNEKYYYLSGNLPTATSHFATIRAGDLMLYGSSCVVLFYETFQTSYSYTRLGVVENPSGLASALGSGRVTVRFE